MYVAGALEYETPFLAPFYRFLSLHPRGSTRPVPSYVAFVPWYLAAQVAENRHYSRSAECVMVMSTLRVDAQASEGRTGVGGWWPMVGSSGVPDPSRSLWFSVEVTKETCSWANEGDNTPGLLISALKVLAFLLALKLFF